MSEDNTSMILDAVKSVQTLLQTQIDAAEKKVRFMSCSQVVSIKLSVINVITESW